MKLVTMRDSKSRVARLEGSSPSPGTRKNRIIGRVAELVYAYVSEAYPARVGSSNLPAPTMKSKIKIIAIVGPTAVGKSAYAVKLAKKINGEIISADSRQVYRGLDIGSGKITRKEMRGVPHHLLDVASLKKIYNVSNFVSDSKSAIAEIVSRGRTPIVVGGTGFYIDALLSGQVLPEVPPNKVLHKKLEKKTKEQLFVILKKLDSRRAKDIDRDNPVRLIRAIEIATALGKVPKLKNANTYDVQWIGLTADREILRKRIEKRLKARLKQGMLREVKKLRKDGVSWKRLVNLGLEYRYAALHLQGKLSRPEFERILADKIYQYAMRQITWFKRNKNIKWMRV